MPSRFTKASIQELRESADLPLLKRLRYLESIVPDPEVTGADVAAVLNEEDENNHQMLPDVLRMIPVDRNLEILAEIPRERFWLENNLSNAIRSSCVYWEISASTIMKPDSRHIHLALWRLISFFHEDSLIESYGPARLRELSLQLLPRLFELIESGDNVAITARASQLAWGLIHRFCDGRLPEQWMEAKMALVIDALRAAITRKLEANSRDIDESEDQDADNPTGIDGEEDIQCLFSFIVLGGRQAQPFADDLLLIVPTWVECLRLLIAIEAEVPLALLRSLYDKTKRVYLEGLPESTKDDKMMRTFIVEYPFAVCAFSLWHFSKDDACFDEAMLAVRDHLIVRLRLVYQFLEVVPASLRFCDALLRFFDDETWGAEVRELLGKNRAEYGDHLKVQAATNPKLAAYLDDWVIGGLGSADELRAKAVRQNDWDAYFQLGADDEVVRAYIAKAQHLERHEAAIVLKSKHFRQPKYLQDLYQHGHSWLVERAWRDLPKDEFWSVMNAFEV